jgi:phosphomannomutase/phosphoglucomutase
MQVPAHIFREYDIRGLVDEEVTAELVYGLGRAFATFVARRLGKAAPTLAVGRDVRPSSDSYRDAMVEGLRESGARVLDIGLVPTPVLYYATGWTRTAAS